MSHSLAHSVLDALPDIGVFLIDADERIVAWYRGARRLLGYSAEEVIGRRALGDLLHSDSAARPLPAEPVALRRRDGAILRAQLDIEPLGEELSGTRVVVVRDSDRLSQAEPAEPDPAAAWRAALDTVDASVLVLELDGTIRHANRATRTRYGERLAGKDICRTIRHRRDPAIDQALQRCLLRFEPVMLEQRLLSTNRSVQVIVAPWLEADGRARGLILVETDITNERMLELEVRLQNRQVKDHSQRLQRQDRLKRHWLNAVSHELRSPLTSIRSYSELLLSYPDTEPGEREEFLTIILTESERLSRLISDLLDLAHIESGRLAWQPSEHDAVALLRECIELMRPQARTLETELIWQSAMATCAVFADRDRLKQVVVNLLSNALKFGRPGSPVRVELQGDAQDLTVAVEDDGPGVPPEDRETIFEFYARRDQRVGESAPAGTGLGLAISRQIIRHHGGALACRSARRLGGARFEFTIPRFTGESHPPRSAELETDVPSSSLT